MQWQADKVLLVMSLDDNDDATSMMTMTTWQDDKVTREEPKNLVFYEVIGTCSLEQVPIVL